LYASAVTVHFYGVSTSKDSFSEALNGKSTNDIYLYRTPGSVYVYYKDTADNKIRYVQNVSNGYFEAAIANITFKNTKLPLKLSVVWDGSNSTLKLDTSNGNDTIIYLANNFSYLGHGVGDTVTANDLMYGSTDISGFTTDFMTRNGIIVYNPRAHLPGDWFEFSINGDERIVQH
jgi:hypothetical protein